MIEGRQDGQVIDALVAAQEIATATMFLTRLDATTLAETRQCVAVTVVGIYAGCSPHRANACPPLPTGWDRARARSVRHHTRPA
ncbi:hypothetical protein [Streptomyces sp. NPDC050416]|uniref:hypothetical protein n=1 Tax=Streptomyces sp. NPDC050416 TaxID=3365611 RepID=UPI0037AB5516